MPIVEDRNATARDDAAMINPHEPLVAEEIEFVQRATSGVLAAVCARHAELCRLARAELAERGQDARGVWVGFGEALRQFQASAPEQLAN